MIEFVILGAISFGMFVIAGEARSASCMISAGMDTNAGKVIKDTTCQTETTRTTQISGLGLLQIENLGHLSKNSRS